MPSWYVQLLDPPLPQPRFLARDAKGYHTTSLERATKFRSKKAAKSAKEEATEEWPDASFEVVRC